VIVMLPRRPVLKSGGSVAKLPGRRPSTLGQKPQGSVNGRIPDVRMFCAHPSVQLINGYVGFSLLKGPDNLLALAGCFEAPFPQKLLEGFFHKWIRDFSILILIIIINLADRGDFVKEERMGKRTEKKSSEFRDDENRGSPRKKRAARWEKRWGIARGSR
jgi:hypothetical protein